MKTPSRWSIYPHRLAHLLWVCVLVCGLSSTSGCQPSNQSPASTPPARTSASATPSKAKDAPAEQAKNNTAKRPHTGLRPREEEALALLSIARSHHRRSRIAMRLQRREKALQEINSILALQFPRGFKPGEEVLLDAWAYKATLLLRLKKKAQARTTIERAIQKFRDWPASFYRAQLYHVWGQVLEASGEDIPALRAYQQSIALNKLVIRRAQRSLTQQGSLSSVPRTAVPKRRTGQEHYSSPLNKAKPVQVPARRLPTPVRREQPSRPSRP